MGEISDYHIDKFTSGQWGMPTGKRYEEPYKWLHNLKITKEETKMALIPMSVAKTNEGLDSILYGKPKTGKTTTLGECGYKVLLADLEGGTAVLEGADNVLRVPIESYEDMIELGKSIKQGYISLDNGDHFDISEYEMIAIDSISRLQDLCKDWIATKYAPNRRREINDKFGAMADWGDLKEQLYKLVKAYHTLTKQGDKSKHVMWIAHEEVETVENSVGQVVPVATKIQLQGKETANIIMSIVDAIFYMARKEKTDPETKVKTVQYGVLTQSAGIYQAAVRQSKFRKDAEQLPNFIENPNWKEIFEKLGYKAGE